MTIVRYNSRSTDFVPTSFNTLIDRFFDQSLARSGGSQYSFIPKVDISEDEKAFKIQLVVPGMSKEDFKIDLTDEYLTLSGERKFTHAKENNFHVRESAYGTFSRSFVLPDNIDVNEITAKYENGILEINLPKDEKKAVKATIEVK